MGSKGSNTTTTNQTQSYTPTGAGYITGALDRAQSAANLPFAIPQAPVAGFSDDQMAAFGNVRNAQGAAQPYFNQAAGLYNQGATGANISNFFNPYAQAVTDNLKDIFGSQMRQTTGNLTQAAGGVGADRIAVGQAELARQQGLSAGQTLASLYQPALQAAQNAAFTGASGLANVGQASQNAALQGSQALLGTGGLQQQLSQAQMNAPYQLEMARAAFPYQQSQFLSGTVGSLAPSLGGTTTGHSETTKPAPSLFSQILGGITGGVGLLGGTGAFGNSGWLTGGKGSSPQTGATYGGYGPGASGWGSFGGVQYPAFARGGRTDPFVIDLRRRNDGSYGFDDGGAVPDDPMSVIPDIPLAAPQPHIPQLNLAPPKEETGSGGGGKGSGLGDVAKLAMMFVNRGGRVNAYASGGEIDDVSPATFDERFPYRMPEPEAVEAWRANAPAPDRAEDAPVMAFSGDPAAMPPAPRARPAGAAPALPAAPTAEAANPYSAPAAAAPEAPAARDASSSFASSPWAALMAAGFGMMAGDSPFAGVNIGQGGLQGMKVLEAQRAAAQKDATIAQAARRLAIEAKHHEDQYTRMTPYQKAQVARAEQAAAVEALKPVQIGQDAYGRPVYAKRNPKTGEYEEIRPTQEPVPAAPAAPTAPVKAPAATGQDESALPVNAKPTQGLLPNGTFGTVDPPKEGTNPDALEGMRPGDVKLVKAISEGRQKFLPIGRNNPYNRYIMEKVHEYDPSVDETAFSRRQRTANFFAVGTQGGGGQNITAMNTFGQHADELLKISEKLNLGDYPTWNAVKNALAKQGFTDKETQDLIGSWEVAAKAVADEGAKVFAGSNSALADREEWGKKFDVNNPKTVTRAKLQEVVKLIEGRLNALTAQYNEGMRTTHDAKDFIAPRTREIFDRIAGGKEGAEKRPDDGAPKVGERRQFRQGWGRWDGTKWVPDNG